jgi:hypothetical protein
MKPLSLDTPLSIEQRWSAGLRDRGALWRLRRLVSLTNLCWQAAGGAFQRARPEATPREREAYLLRERYGPDIAHRVMERHRTQGLCREADMTSDRWSSGVGPRVAEPALMLINPYPWSAPLQDARLKPE